LNFRNKPEAAGSVRENDRAAEEAEGRDFGFWHLSVSAAGSVASPGIDAVA